MNLTYQLGRCVLSVTGNTWWRWDLATQRFLTYPVAFTASVVQISDRMSARIIDVGPSSHWATLDSELILSPDGRITGATRTTSGRGDEAVLAVVKGFLAGVTPSNAEENKKEEKDDGTLDANETENPSDRGPTKAPSKDPVSGEQDTSAPTESREETNQAEKQAPQAGNQEETPPEKTAVSDKVPGEKSEETGRGADDSSRPKAPWEPGWVADAVWTAYSRANPGRANIGLAYRSALKKLSERLQDDLKTEDYESILTHIGTIATQLADADAEFQEWVRDHSEGRRVDVAFDLELWDLPVEVDSAQWKRARGAKEIAAALAVAARPDRPQGTVARRDSRRAVDALFRQLGLVFAIAGIERIGEDTNLDAIVDTTDNEEVKEYDPQPFVGLQYRQPYHVTLACYRLTSGPDGTERLDLIEHRSVPIISELSAVHTLQFDTSATGNNSYEIELSDLGSPARLASVSGAKRADAVELAGKILEQVIPVAAKPMGQLGKQLGGGLLNIWGNQDIGIEPEVSIGDASVPQSTLSHEAEVARVFSTLERHWSRLPGNHR